MRFAELRVGVVVAGYLTAQPSSVAGSIVSPRFLRAAILAQRSRTRSVGDIGLVKGNVECDDFCAVFVQRSQHLSKVFSREGPLAEHFLRALIDRRR